MSRYTERITTLVDKKTLKQIKAATRKSKTPLSEWLRLIIGKELN